MDLDGLAGTGHGDLAGIELGQGGLGLVGTPQVLEPRCPICRKASRLHRHLHIRDLELESLERPDGPTEGLAFLRVLDALVEASLGQSHR